MLDVFLVLIVEHRGIIIELIHIARRWLIHLHIGKPLLLLFQLFCLLLFLFGCSFLLSLYFPELIENVLVMEESVRKFVLEDVSLQKLRYSFLYYGDLQDPVDCRSGIWILIEHLADEIAYCGREMTR